MRIEFVAADRTKAPKGGAVAVMAFEEGKLSGAAEDMDKAITTETRARHARG